MADIDVQAIGLASPPPKPYQDSYTPGILVRNNGRSDAAVSGYVQCFDKDTGVQLFLWPVSLAKLVPGQTGTASAAVSVDLSSFDPGKQLLFAGKVTTPGDMVKSNDVLPPVTVTVQEGESPVPPIVADHAAQHENGGTDELNLDGLAGKLAERQTPTEHASNHEDGGDDQLEVDGLAGELADPQTPKLHASTHGPGGADPVSGIEPAAHHATHEPGGDDEITGLGVSEHGSDKHDATVEATANKGAASGYAALDSSAIVPAIQLGSGSATIGKVIVANGSGSQAWDDAPEPAGVEHTANKGASNGYAPLDAGALVPAENLPAIPPAVHGNEVHEPAMVTFEALGESLADYQLKEDKDTANGYAGLDGDGLLKVVEFPPGIERTANKGAANGYAPLDAGGLVPEANLPGIPPSVHGTEKHDSSVEATAHKDTAGGYAGLDAEAKVAATFLGAHDDSKHSISYEKEANKNQPSGYAGLNASSKISQVQLPDGIPLFYEHLDSGWVTLVPGDSPEIIIFTRTIPTPSRIGVIGFVQLRGDAGHVIATATARVEGLYGIAQSQLKSAPDPTGEWSIALPLSGTVDVPSGSIANLIIEIGCSLLSAGFEARAYVTFFSATYNP